MASRVSRVALAMCGVRDDVLHRQQLVAHGGLVLEDVERGTGDRAGLERPDERRLVDHLPARGVDEHGRWLHGLERGSAPRGGASQ